MTTLTPSQADAVLADGRVVHVRPLAEADLPAVEHLHEIASERSLYLRYFSANREAARRYLPRLVRSDPRHHSIGVFLGAELLGVGVYERLDDVTAEFALQVADAEQHHGVGTLLLEHLAAHARREGIERFTADVLAENAPMLEVLHLLGFRTRTTNEAGTVLVEFVLAEAAAYATAVDHRDRHAEQASLRPLLAPGSVAVVGAGRRVTSVGHQVLRNLLTSGFTGRIDVVNPHHRRVFGLTTVASVADLDQTPDLAIVAVPADQVAGVVRECGVRGCRGVIVVSSGFGETGAGGVELQNEILAAARDHGMRLIGPNCVGVVNNDPRIRLDATFARVPHRDGQLALFAQSGAFGIGLLDAADRAGLGVRQFVSLGNKADVGGNDLLLAWADDPAIGAIAMYLESVEDPIRFAHVAPQISTQRPLIALKSGRTDAGSRAGRSHTAAAAAPDVLVDALFASCGVQRVDTTDELLAAARVVTSQPAPNGPRLAVVGNSGGPGILAVDAAERAGLQIAAFDDTTRAALRELGVADNNPIDLGAAARPETVRSVLDAVLGSPSVDLVATVFTEVAVVDLADVRAAILEAAAERPDLPVVAVEVGGRDTTLPVLGTPSSIPVFGTPERAVAAAGVAWAAARFRLRAAQPGPPPGRVDVESAARIVAAASASVGTASAATTGSQWLRPDEVERLLRYYGVPVCPQRVVADPDAAAAAADAFGYPVAVKLAAPGLHKSDLGGVRLGLANGAEVRAAATQLAGLGHGPTVLVMPMVADGPEFIVGGLRDERFGALVMAGTGGILTSVLGDQVFRLAPLGAAEAEDLIAATRAARLLDGVRGSAPVSRTALRDVVVAVSRLLADHPHIAELDLNPIRGQGDGVVVLDARVRIADGTLASDPLMRRLRPPRAVPADRPR